MMNHLRPVPAAREQFGARLFVPRHVHDRAYAAIVLSGGYEERGSRGRFRVVAGDVLFHRAFDAHLNEFSARGATILNVGLPDHFCDLEAAHLSDVDSVVRVAEKDPRDATAMLLATSVTLCRQVEDWQDILANQILSNTGGQLGQWARQSGLAPGTLSRGFLRRYGVSPSSFRAEARTREAYFQIVGTLTSLADIAQATGFADQAHMTRAVHAYTGSPPGHWRARSNLFKTTRGTAG